MKYTNFLLKEDLVNVKNLDNGNVLFKPITISLSIIGAMGGLCLIGGMFPMTYAIDTFRNVRYQYLKNYRKTHPFKQINLN